MVQQKLTNIFLLFVFILQVSSPLFATKTNHQNSIPEAYSKSTNPKTSSSDSDDLDGWIHKAKNSIKKKILSNGLTVLFYKLPTTCEVMLKIVYNVGSRHEKPEQFGLAHVVEHMIFKGTDSISETDIVLLAKKFGDTVFNASTSNDQTEFFFITDNKNWPIFLSVLANLMENPRFNEKHLNSEIKTIVSELNLRQAQTNVKVAQTLQETFSDLHPYKHLTIGTKENLANFTSEDLKDFFHEHYTPNNAVLIVVGNVDEKTLFEEVEKSMGGNIAETQSNIDTPNPINQKAFLNTDFIQRNITIRTKTTALENIMFWPAPGKRSKKSLQTQCVSHILNERFKKLKDPNAYNLVHEIYTSNFSYFDNGFLHIWFSPRIRDFSKTPGSPSCEDHCRILIENELHDLMYNGPTKEELRIFKTVYKTNFINIFEHINPVSNILKHYCLNDNEYEAFDRLNYVQQLTSHNIKKFCLRYLQSNLANTITIGPLQVREEGTWTQIQQEIDSYEQELLNNKNRENPSETRLIEQLPEPKIIDFSFSNPDKQVTLSNGITVYIKQQTHAPGLTMSCGFKKDTLKNIFHGQQKLTHIPYLAMDLLNKESRGTADHPENITLDEHEDFFNSYGARYLIFPSECSLSCLPCDFEALTSRFFHIISHPTYPEQAFHQAVYRIKNSLLSITESASQTASRKLHRHLYQKYPWEYDGEKIVEHVTQYKRDHLVDFHKQWIQPENMFVIIVGNIEPQAAIDVLEKACSGWKKNDDSSTEQFLSRITIPDIKNPSAKEIKLFFPGENITLLAGRLTTTTNTTASLALVLLEDHFNYLLHRIREESGLFYHCHAQVAPQSSFFTKGQAFLETEISQNNILEAKQKIKSTMRNFSKTGLTEEEFTAAKQSYILRLAKHFSTNTELEGIYSFLIGNNQPFSYLENRVKMLHKLTLEQVNKMAMKYFEPNEWTFIEVGRFKDDASA